MRGLFGLVVVAVAAVLPASLAHPLVVHAGTVDDIVVTKDNILNSTSRMRAPQADNPLQIDIINNFGSSQMYLYITGQDNNGIACFVGADGQLFYPDASGSTEPTAIVGNIATALGGMGSITTVILPDFLGSSRIWVSEGELQFSTVIDSKGNPAIVVPSATNPDDPSANIRWGFVEFNWQNDQIFANISYVDWVGISMGVDLMLASGETQVVRGLQPGAIDKICNDVRTQNSHDNAGWDQLCVMTINAATNSSQVLRVLSPNMYISENHEWQSHYYSDYIDQVWTRYASEDLTIDTQSAAGEVACRVSGNQLTCDGDNRGYPKPSAADIYGCNSGPFMVVESDNAIHRAIVPRLCAAFNRSTLLLDGGNVQPGVSSGDYYTTDPTNHYARIVHAYEQDSLGYAFSYDDVNSGGENVAGTVSGANPTLLRITVGSWI
ncbi:glycoside hydrolase family 64 protein [Xylaria sp. CBS 124048]|nr:glycoside hydrolase family 64 protein [Xylaria sp. CBS 124048]